MQSMFRLPWSTDGDKIMEKATMHKPRPMPVVDMPGFINKIKRKRTDSPEPAPVPNQHAHVVKKWKGPQGQVKPVEAVSRLPATVAGVSESKPAHVPVVAAPQLNSRPIAQPRKESPSKSKVSKSQPPAATPKSVNTPDTAMESGLTAVQQAIEAQINYEILLKHNELRLIEQELAKCQVSLEQLRRCSLIPFPGADGLSEQLSLGTGASLQPPSGYTEPQYAAPWGVTDGPYTRHYAKWLISDVKFDPVSERALAQQAQGYFGGVEGRSTRHSFAEYGSASRGRTSRTSTGMLKLMPLGETPAPAPKIDPLLHKRSTDGQWVRLYCAQCGHSNFSNTQGFLNHCRIKHNQVFKSHDQAAIACGVPVDVNEGGQPVAATEPVSTPAATPAVTFPVQTTTPGNVHPLATQPQPDSKTYPVHRDPKASPPAPLATATSFSKSSTPYLMAQAKNAGFKGDLRGLVETARAKIDLDSMDMWEDDSADSSEAPTPISSKPPQQLARLPASSPHAVPASKAHGARPGSKKGNTTMAPSRLPLSFPSPTKSDSEHHMLDSPVDLSPNAVESNPGLVSDHDDDDDDEFADDAHSQPDLLMDDDVVVEDASDVEGVQERTGSRQGLNGCFEKGEGSRKH